MAAAVIQAANLPEGTTVWDPFCGSGTLNIEYVAAVTQLPSFAAGMLRKDTRDVPAAEEGSNVTTKSISKRRGPLGSFAFEKWPIHSSLENSYSNFLDQLIAHGKAVGKASQEKGKKLITIGTDCAQKRIDAAKSNSQVAGTYAFSKFMQGDFIQVSSKIPDNVAIITHLPYEGTLNEDGRTYESYSKFGRMLNMRPDIKSVFVLAAHPDFAVQTKLRWKKVLEFHNGPIPVCLFQLLRGDAVADPEQRRPEKNEREKRAIHTG